ncbi:hypothetical protein BN1723_003196, partial [Verticillium longisporum]
MVLRLLNPSMLHGIAVLMIHAPVALALPSQLGITRPSNASTTCGGNVVCPGDRTCVDFEGTVGCAVPGLSWCALNPITFEAAGCDGGVCCHGNCYVSGAICCDYESVKCVLGELCNVCSPGETCNKGGCVGGSGEVKSMPRIDNFVNKGCFYDANLERRVLRADSTVDASNTGDAKQLCGDGNRIQVYQDETWFMPTIQQLVEDLKAYNETLKEARSAVAQYKEDLEEYQKNRQERERKILERLVGGSKNLNRIQASIKPFAPKIIRGFKIAKRYDITVAGPTRVDEETANALEAAGEVDEETANALEATVQSSIESFQRPVDAAAADSAQAEPALEMDILPNIDVTAHLDIASIAIDKIGIAAVAGRVATGIFASLVAVLAVLIGSPGGGSPNEPPKPTATPTITTSTSSSTCTMTATQTPIIIVTQKGTSKDQYDELVRSLPKNEANIQKTNSWLSNWIYIATLDQRTAEALWENPIVLSMSIDAEVTVEDFGLDSSSSATNTPGKRATDSNTNTTDPLYRTAVAPLQPRSTPGPNSRFKQQTPGSPGHLNWLAQLSRYTQLQGSYLDFEEFVFEDAATRDNEKSTVFVIDQNFLRKHVDFKDRVVGAWSMSLDGETEADIFYSGNDHGTCMVSLAAGAYSGVSKRANIVMVQLMHFDDLANKLTVSRTIFALLSIQRYVYDNNLFGRSVISMSFSLPVASLWWEDPRTQGTPVTKYTDPYQVYLPEFMAQGIVAVASAGNDALKEDENIRDLSYSTPRAAGGRDSGLIVVGNARYDGSRNLKSQYVDVRRKGILSLYNIGTDVDCAGTESLSNEAGDSGQTWKHQSGTSPATAITAGMAAYLLSHPVIGPQLRAGGNGQVAMNVKNYLINTGQRLKGDAGTGDGVPRAALGEMVPCQGGQAGRPVIPPVFMPALPGRLDIRIFSTRDITDGQNVLVNANCWDLQ